MESFEPVETAVTPIHEVPVTSPSQLEAWIKALNRIMGTPCPTRAVLPSIDCTLTFDVE